MQLLDSLKNQPSEPSEIQRLSVLEEIAHHVQIQPNFCFSHALYPPLELRLEIFNSLQQLSVPQQDQYLRLRLGNYLLSIYDTPRNPVAPMPDPDVVRSTNQHQSVQNMTQGVHSVFYKRLHEKNSGQGFFDPGWLVLRQEADGLLAVQKDSLTLHVSRDRHLAQSNQGPNIGDSVAVRLPRNRLENGCYVAIGNAGDPSVNPASNIDLVNLYFNLGAEDLAILMKDITVALNAVDLPFTFQVPYEPENCDRPDAGILKIAKADYDKIQPILKSLYQTHASAFHPETALFTKQLAPGLAVAEAPTNRFTPQESFSMHRFQIIADGYLKTWRQGEESPDLRMKSILQSFAHYDVDVNRPFLNADAEDCYSPLF